MFMKNQSLPFIDICTLRVIVRFIIYLVFYDNIEEFLFINRKVFNASVIGGKLL